MMQAAPDLMSDSVKARQSLLFHRDFRLLWAGESASLIGSAGSYVAFPLVAVLTLHASVFQVGVLAMAGRLPPLVFGAFAGVVVDRLPRRKLMIWADLGRMALLAWESFLPSVVGPEQLADGNGKLAASQSVAEVTGPGIAGWTMALAGPPGALVIDAASFAALLLTLSTRRPLFL